MEYNNFYWYHEKNFLYKDSTPVEQPTIMFGQKKFSSETYRTKMKHFSQIKWRRKLINRNSGKNGGIINKQASCISYKINKIIKAVISRRDYRFHNFINCVTDA